MEEIFEVECIEGYYNVTKGCKYQITGQDCNYYKLIDDNNNEDWYKKTRFKPVEPQKEEAEEVFEVECINCKGKVCLTEGKTYLVKQSKEYDRYYELVNDSGARDTYLKERFKPVNKLEGESVKKVRCINADNFKYLTLNKVYDCENIGIVLTTIKDDEGEVKHYPSGLFEKAEEKKEYSVIEVLEMPKGTTLKLFPYDESERRSCND